MSNAAPFILLSSPYTLLEEEALGWSLLFADRVLFLHPFPLDLPDNCRPLLDRGMIQVLAPSRTPEEIREKDRRLREFRAFAAQNPDFSFLEYLKQSPSAEPVETRDEILEQLRGGSSGSGRPEGGSKEAAGEMLLCLIHDWLSQQWEIDRSLDRVAGQEKALAEIMETGFEFSGDWAAPGAAFVAPVDSELNCPPALEAWRKLKERLAPAASCLLTTQEWVWRGRYRLDPEDPSVLTLPLPGWPSGPIDSFLTDLQSRAASGSIQPIRELFWEFALKAASAGQKAERLKSALEALLFPGAGRYVLVFPPLPGPETAEGEKLLLLRRNRAM